MIVHLTPEYEAQVRARTVLDEITLYALAVVADEIPACRKLHQAAHRHLTDLRRSEDPDFPFYFDLDAAYRPIKFVGMLSHWEGELAGQLFKPELWECFVIGSTFGWRRKDTHLRRYRYAYVEVPRKNGKSFLAAAIALYLLCADGEAGAQVYAAATKREQAKIVWDCACKVVAKHPTLAKAVKLHWLALRFAKKNARFEPLAADSKKLDGLNPHGVVCDELHAWPDRDLWDVLEDAFGARTQPLMFVITTAGHDRNSICYQQRSHGASILEAVESRAYVDDTYFVFIADVDAEDEKNWMKEEVWRKANPGLGAPKSLEYLRDQYNKARLMPQKENAFKNKQLDMWTEAEEKWFDMEAWDACRGKVDRARLAKCRCYGGLDLSSTIALSAFALVFPPGPYPEWTVLLKLYLPADNLRTRAKRDKVPYEQWVRQGWITTTPGNVIDFDFIRADVLRLKEEFNLVEVGFDPWKAVEISGKLQGDGLVMKQMRQGHATLGAPTSEFERKLMKHDWRHGANPVLRWMVRNCVPIRDSNNNLRPDKEKSHAFIDGVVATIMGLGLAIASPTAGAASVYETRGLLILGGPAGGRDPLTPEDGE
jgi:phage terminase large subunit-like protein